MDIKKLQAILMSKGIRISDDDPVFTFVALNEAVLEDMTKKHQLALSNIKTHPSNQNSQAIGWLTSLTITAITSLAVGVAIGSNSRFFILIGLVGLIIGTMLGIVCSIFLKKSNVTAPIPTHSEVVDQLTWTEDEFLQVAITSQLTKRTLDACHDVLVGGISSSEAAIRHGVIQPQVSRGLKILQN